MADYYPLIAKAVTALENSTGEARRALYERARTALVAQLRGVIPALSESDITRERLALEEAIRKVEAEAARRSRQEAPKFNPPPVRLTATLPPEVSAPAQPAALEPEPEGEAKSPPSNKPVKPPTPRPAAANRPARERTSLTDEGLKDFREVFADPKNFSAAAAQALRTARETHATSSPSPAGARPGERPEQRQTADRQRAFGREPASMPGSRGKPSEELSHEAPPPMLEPAINVPDTRPTPPRRRVEATAEPEAAPLLPRHNYGRLIAIAVVVLLVIGLGGVGYWQRANIASLFQFTQSKPTPAPRNGPGPAKIDDRIQSTTPPASATTAPGQQQQPGAAVAQRAVLYEEDASNPQGKRFLGSVIWRSETVPAGAGQAPDVVIRADVEVPERRLTMAWSLRRNADQALPASHTIEIMFNLPADFPGGGISNVPGVLMKQAEQTRGTPLAGLAVKVTTGFFLIGLSAVETDVQRNVQLLKERAWFDIPVVYNNGTRAILAIEKGIPGERAFDDAFRAWGK